MNELFTILIILAAIISFLNKIFKQQKKQQTTRGQPAPKPKPREWIPPWLEPDEIESPVLESREEKQDVADKIKYEKPAVEVYDQEKEPPSVTVQERKIEPIIPQTTIDGYETPLTGLKALNIELSSSDDLRRGIVLAEILGPCSARRNLKKR